MNPELGRLSSGEVGKPVVHDDPSKQGQAVQSQLDAVVDALKALCAKLDTDAVGGADYAATISDSLKKIVLYL